MGMILREYYAGPTGILFHQSKADVRYEEGPVGCLPARTEFLTPTGWKAISEYTPGDLVAQWEQSGRVTWVEPTDYIKAPCEQFIKFANGHRLLMEVTPEHRMPLYQFDGKFVVKTAAEVKREPSRHTIPTAFKPDSKGMPFTDCALRLMVAICADGCYPADNPKSTNAKDYCIVTVRKERKKERLQALLEENNVAYEVFGHSTRATETTYRFRFRELHGKRYTAEWWQASQKQTKLILEECLLWDGHDGTTRTYYSSKHEGDADFIQYCAHANGWFGWKAIERPRVVTWSDIYKVELARPNSDKAKVMLRGDNLTVSEVPSLDGFKYCFSVPSTFFLVRHEGRIFVTGNSGKSTTGIMELLSLAMTQQPDEQKVRRSRFAIIRATNPQLRSTTIKTFEMWIPNETAPVVYTAPIAARMQQRLSDGTTIDCEFIFLALDVPEDVKKLTSLELTAAYINEVREIEHTHFETLQGRIGRFPQTKRDATGKTVYGPTRPCIIMDSNPPKTTHWTFEMFHTGKLPDGYAIFIQPPAVIWDEENEKWELNPDAENLLHLPDGYYARQLNGATDEYIRVMLAGEPGMSSAGKPVFPSFSERRHVAPQVLTPIRGIPLLIGVDFGLTPAAIFGQLTSRGIRIYDELPATDESLEDFVQDYMKPLILSKYPGYPVMCWGDPAGRGRSGLDKRTPFDVLLAAGFKAMPASTNNFITRKETVEFFLRRDEGLLISPNCVVVREGFAGGYVFKEQRNNSGRYSERPDKNEYSHSCFTGDTLVGTPNGVRAIRDIQVGEEVCTPLGPRQVEVVLESPAPEILVEVQLSDGRTIVCTPDHPFITAGGLVRADELQYSDVLFSIQERSWVARLSIWFRSLMA